MELIIIMAIVFLIYYAIGSRFEKAELRIALCINNGKLLIGDEFSIQTIRISDGLDKQSIDKLEFELACYRVFLRNGFKSNLRSVVYNCSHRPR